LTGAAIKSPVTKLDACTGACPGASPGTFLVWEYSYKNHDELINATVRG